MFRNTQQTTTHVIMSLIHENLKFLRLQKRMTQQQFADLLKIKRSSLGAYEEERAKPNYDLLTRLTELFPVTIDQLINEDLSAKVATWMDAGGMDTSGKNLRVLAVSVDSEHKEYIDLVPQKAAAGYLNGYADPQFVEELPKFRLPNLSGGTYRAFEISGDSMLPIQPGSIVVGQYVEDWNQIKDGQTYIIVSDRDGIVYKRVFNNIADRKELILQSDNPAYPPYTVPVEDVVEVWQAKAYISTIFPEKGDSANEMMKMLIELQQEVVKLKKDTRK